MKAVIYTRVSTAEQGKSGLGLQAQLDAITEFCKVENIEVVGHFEGCDLNLKQPQQKGCQRGLFFAKTVSIFEPLKLMPVNLKCQSRRVVSNAYRQDKIAVL